MPVERGHGVVRTGRFADGVLLIDNVAIPDGVVAALDYYTNYLRFSRHELEGTSREPLNRDAYYSVVVAWRR